MKTYIPDDFYPQCYHVSTPDGYLTINPDDSLGTVPHRHMATHFSTFTTASQALTAAMKPLALDPATSYVKDPIDEAPYFHPPYMIGVTYRLKGDTEDRFGDVICIDHYNINIATGETYAYRVMDRQTGATYWLPGRCITGQGSAPTF